MGAKLTGHAVIPKRQLRQPERIIDANNTLALLSGRALEACDDTREYYGVPGTNMSVPEIGYTKEGDLELDSIGFFCADTFIATFKQWLKNGWLEGPVTAIEVWADADEAKSSCARVIRIFGEHDHDCITSYDIAALNDGCFRLLRDMIENP